MTSPLGGIVPVGIGAIGGMPPTPPPLAAGEGGDGFAAVLAATFDRLQGAHDTTSALSKQAATGDLRDVHDYMIASAEAGVATEMVVTIKNQAIAAFNEIMRMPI